MNSVAFTTELPSCLRLRLSYHQLLSQLQLRITVAASATTIVAIAIEASAIVVIEYQGS